MSGEHIVEMFAAEIQEHVLSDTIQASARGRFSVGGRIVDAVVGILDRLGDGISEDVKRKLFEGAMSVYDFVNIPQIPDAIEVPCKTLLRPVVENMLKTMLGIA